MLQEIATRVTNGHYLPLLHKKVSKEKVSVEWVDISVDFKFNGVMWKMNQWDSVWNNTNCSDVIFEKSDGSLEVYFGNSCGILMVDVFDKHLSKKVSLNFFNEMHEDLHISISTFLYKKKNPFFFWKKQLDFVITDHQMNDEKCDNESQINFIFERMPEFLF